MIYVLIVDDCKIRTKKLLALIDKSINNTLYKIDFCESSFEARQLLSLKQYDLLILDVVLPKRTKSRDTSAKEGLNLLEEVNDNNNETFTPKKTIGITSNEKDLGTYRKKFELYTSVILEAKIHKNHWMKIIMKNIESLIETQIKINNNSESLLITFHGIRTFGKWQNKLEEIIESKVSNFTCEQFKYGYYSFFIFLFPFFRNRIINKLFNPFSDVIQENKDKKIFIVSHSFGTYISLKLLEKIDNNIKIDTLILAGSVIPDSYDLTKLLSTKVNRIVNECGKNDIILIGSKLFVPAMGDAGRIGFIGNNNKKNMLNRFYSGGHSLYFEKLDSNENFMTEQWIPLLLDSNEDIKKIDERKNIYCCADFFEGILTFWIKIKDIVLYSIPLYFIYEWLI